MAALGSNMGNKPKKEAALVSDKLKKKTAKVAKAAKPDAKKKITAKADKQKEKTTVRATKKAPVAKTKPVKKKAVAKASSAAKPIRKTATSKKTSVKTTQPKKTEAKPVVQKVKAQSQVKPGKDTPKKGGSKRSLRNASLILEPSKRKKIRKTKVILEGDLSINNVDAFMDQIEPIFDDYDFIDFYQREVTSLDLCHIQMLYYFQHHPGRKGKTVTINSEMSADLKKVVINVGFKEFMFIPKLV